jgi:nucleoside 2-deoxyribosyltransferase
VVKIYIAGPLFNTHERRYLEEVAAAMESAGYKTFLPHRDAGILNNTSEESRRHIFQSDLQALDEADGCVALLTGPDHDSGTSAELGYMYARGKPCFGLTDDIRWMNNLIWGLCNYGKYITRDIDELVNLLKVQLPNIKDDE